MKLLLVRPPRRDSADAGLSVPPLGLAYIAAVARDGGHDVEIIDAYALDMTGPSSGSGSCAPARCPRSEAMTPVADVAARAVTWRAPTRAGSCWADPTRRPWASACSRRCRA